MTEFSDFYQSLLKWVKSYEQEKNTMLKVEKVSNDDDDGENQTEMIRIFGEKASPVSRAKNGLEDVAELAYTTAEHHPYWALLYHCQQISKTALDKWDDDLSREELDEIDWSIDELKNACKKLKEGMEKKE